MGRKQLGKILRVIGHTTDGRPVVAGLMKFCFTLGLPLEDALFFLIEKEYIPSWAHLYLECRREGIDHNATLIKIFTAVEDVYEPDTANLIKFELSNMAKELNAGSN